MGLAFEGVAVEFIADMSVVLAELAGGADHRAECVIEASNLVAALIDADGRHSDAELNGWIGALGDQLEPPMFVTAQTLRSDDTFGGRRSWLEHPSTMFDLLVRADAADTLRRSNRYYRHAMALVHATAAIDLVPSPSEIDAIDRFRSVLLHEMDAHGVPRPGQPAAPLSTSSPTPPDRQPTSNDAANGGATEPELELPPERSIEDLLAELDELVGLSHVKAEVRRLTSLLRIQRLRAERNLPTVETSKHFVFSGNPGTGKTTVARLLSQIFRTLGVVTKGHLVETDRSGLVAGFVGQTATRTKQVLDSALGGTLIIDEAYALARGGENDFGLEAVDTIVKFIEDHRDDLCVIAAGYPEEMRDLIDSNPGLESRFTRTVHFPDYDTDELVMIFQLISGNKEYHLDTSGAARLSTIIGEQARGRGFGNGRFVRNVFEAAVGHQALRLADTEAPSDEQLTTLSAADINPVD